MNIDFKVDIEGYELDALPEWIESGALEKVFSSQELYFTPVLSCLYSRWIRWLLSFIWGEYTHKRSEISMGNFFYKFTTSQSRNDSERHCHILNHLAVL